MRGVSDKALIQAMRQRLMSEIGKGHSAHDAASIVNNVYGGHGGGGGGGGHAESHGGGVMDRLANHVGDQDDDSDYLVDITRRDLEDVNPHTGKPAGWTKSVRRHREKKKT